MGMCCKDFLGKNMGMRKGKQRLKRIAVGAGFPSEVSETKRTRRGKNPPGANCQQQVSLTGFSGGGGHSKRNNKGEGGGKER